MIPPIPTSLVSLQSGISPESLLSTHPNVMKIAFAVALGL
jgi:hypothetical protein